MVNYQLIPVNPKKNVEKNGKRRKVLVAKEIPRTANCANSCPLSGQVAGEIVYQ